MHLSMLLGLQRAGMYSCAQNLGMSLYKVTKLRVCSELARNSIFGKTEQASWLAYQSCIYQSETFVHVSVFATVPGVPGPKA